MLFDRSDDSATLTRQATCIGGKAKSLMAVPGYSGRVLAVLPDAVYLSGRDGEILWMCREGVPLHGRGILLPLPLQCFHNGEGFRVEGHNLQIGSDLAIDLGQAVEWRPDPGQWEIGPFVGVNDLVRRLLGTIAPNTGGDGAGGVVLGLSSILNGSKEPIFSPEAWQHAILAPVFDLMTHCLKRGLSEIETRGKELIGLGPGLTPCGDDFLGGMFFAAHWLQETCPEKLRFETQSTVNLLQWARNRTHPISHVILCDLAIGQGPEPLHRLLGLLLKGGVLDDPIVDAVHCLLKVGHTTGWTMLAGLLTCLLAADAENNGGLARTSLRVRGDAFLPRQAVVL